MNDVQRKSFELLQLFVNICDKWDIPYYLVCGSALGAVKYGGFIPWDDDIDVGLLRSDYERFLEIAPKELPDWCFLQNYQTEKNFIHSFSKLRNSNTTFIEKNVCHLPMNHGIYLDIFPIDGYPVGKLEKIRFHFVKKWNDWIRYSPLEYPKGEKEWFRNLVVHALGLHKQCYAAHVRLEKLYSAYSVQNSELWCNYGNWQGKQDWSPRWHYGEGAWSSFEGMKVRIPENYDAYLTQKYGNWRADPEKEKQESHHLTVIVDTERSYREYLDNVGTKD